MRNRLREFLIASSRQSRSEMEIIMGHVTNQYYKIMQKTGLASIVALTTKKNPFPQEKVNYLLITGQMKYDSSEYATLKEKI